MFLGQLHLSSLLFHEVSDHKEIGITKKTTKIIFTNFTRIFEGLIVK